MLISIHDCTGGVTRNSVPLDKYPSRVLPHGEGGLDLDIVQGPRVPSYATAAM